MSERPISSTDRRLNYGDRRLGKKDRRWFYPPLIQDRGKSSLPFTTREPDFVPDENTVRRKGDRRSR